jgi:hypothetical protein
MCTSWLFQHVMYPALILPCFIHPIFFAVVIVSIHRPFLLGTSLLAITVIPTTLPSSFRLQYLPYYVWSSKYSCLLEWIYWIFLCMASKFFFKFLLLFRWPQILPVWKCISFLTQFYSGVKIENEMGGACSTYGAHERCIRGFGWESWGEETT